MADYTPINCDLYDHLEIAAMRKRIVRLRLRNTSTALSAQILDLRVQEGAEYLFARTEAGEVLAPIRLDTIVALDDIDFSQAPQCKL